MKPVDPDLIAGYARECMKTKWVHQGRTPGVAIDCAGLVVHVMKRLGVPFEDARGYPRTPYDGVIKKTLDAQPNMRRIHEMKSGCVLLMRTSKHPQHLALWTGSTVIHASSVVGFVTEHRLDPQERLKIIAMYEIVQ